MSIAPPRTGTVYMRQDELPRARQVVMYVGEVPKPAVGDRAGEPEVYRRYRDT